MCEIACAYYADLWFDSLKGAFYYKSIVSQNHWSVNAQAIYKLMFADRPFAIKINSLQMSTFFISWILVDSFS